MRKILAIVITAALLVALLVPSIAVAKSPKTEFDANGWHYNLNLIAKDKTMPGDYDNPDRHTMFVPLDTTGMFIELKQPNKVVEDGSQTGSDVPTLNGIRIDVTQGDEFAMIDGNATDDSDGDGFLDGAFQIGRGTYDVYIAVKAKNPHYADPSTLLAGWIEAYDNEEVLWLYLKVGEVNVKKSHGWVDASTIVWVDSGEDPLGIVDAHGGDPMWVFEYMYWMSEMTYGEDQDKFSDIAYFWQFDNHGNKLIQLRFYPR